jgi:transposase
LPVEQSGGERPKAEPLHRGADDGGLAIEDRQGGLCDLLLIENILKNHVCQTFVQASVEEDLLKAYLLKESLDGLWTYGYERAARRYLDNWIDQLRLQRLGPFQKLAEMLCRSPHILVPSLKIKGRGRLHR